MPFAPSRRKEDAAYRLSSPGRLGVDLDTADGLLPDGAFRRLENVRLSDQALSRRPGSGRLFEATDNTGSMTFGADTKYATIPATSQLLLPKGSWGIRASVTAVRPSGGNTAYVLSSRPNGQTYHLLRITLSSAGVFTVEWRDTGGNTRSVATSAVSAAAAAHLLAIFDAPAGTFTVYVDGVASGTPLTGLASTTQMAQDSGVVWAVGVEKETAAAVTANTHFDGAVDALTLFSMPGIRPSSGSPSLVDTLRKETFREWVNPASGMVRFHYGLNETVGTTMYDASDYKSHGTYVGTPTPSTKVALSRPVGNYVGTFQNASGVTSNLVAAGGRLFYEGQS